MKLIILAVIVLFALSACATATLPTNATPEQKAVALCKDAQLGIIYADTMRVQAQSIDSRAYWERYIEAARAALTTYCMM
jgi:hypothetical protein